MSHRSFRMQLTVVLTVILLFAALMVASAMPISDPGAPLSPENIPNPISITGSPLRVALGSTAASRFTTAAGATRARCMAGKMAAPIAASGCGLGSDIYGPDACFSGRLTTNMYTVRPWTPVSHSGPTGSGTAGDPWVITTVLDAGSSGVRVTQRASYVNGQDYFRLAVGRGQHLWLHPNREPVPCRRQLLRQR